MHDLLDGGFDALDFFGKEIKDLNEQLFHVDTLEKGKDLVEKFLLKKVNQLKEILPFDSSMKILLRRNGNLSIKETASLACLSIKQFERNVKKEWE